MGGVFAMKLGRGSFKFNDVYVKNTCIAIGKLEAQGKLKSYADIVYNDNYFGEKSFEAAERKMQKDVIGRLKAKEFLTDLDIDLLVGGDLINQEIVSLLAMKDFNIPLISLFSACATFSLATIISSVFIDNKLVNRAISMASSHNLSAERTFRYPVEYGGAKEETTTNTLTGCGAMLLTSKKTAIKVTEATIGKVIDVNYNNSFDMGSAMAPAAIETILEHFNAFNTSPKDYDLILTGDLSQIGRSIVQKALNDSYPNTKNYDDCGLIAYDYFEQDVFCGGSGCGCVATVVAGYIYDKLMHGEIKKVLVCATGALMNQTSTLQKESISAIAHAFTLEGEWK